MYDHFIKTHGLVFTGLHILVDFKGINKSNDRVVEVIEQALSTVNATILQKTIHTFPENNGITGCYALAESHLTFHSWWEAEGTLILDLYTCGITNPLNALNVLKEGLEPAHSKVRIYPRGAEYIEPENTRRFYVYTIQHPTTKEIFYVGKGTKNRLKETLKTNNLQHNKNVIIKSIRSEGLEPTLDIVARDITEPLALMIETYLIHYYGKISNNGTLVNVTSLDKPCNTEAISNTLKNYWNLLDAENKLQRSQRIKDALARESAEKKKERYSKRSANTNYIESLKRSARNRDYSYMTTESYINKKRASRLATYRFILEDGREEIVSDIITYCKINSLNLSTLRDRLNHQRKQYGGIIRIFRIS